MYPYLFIKKQVKQPSGNVYAPCVSPPSSSVLQSFPSCFPSALRSPPSSPLFPAPSLSALFDSPSSLFPYLPLSRPEPAVSPPVFVSILPVASAGTHWRIFFIIIICLCIKIVQQCERDVLWYLCPPAAAEPWGWRVGGPPLHPPHPHPLPLSESPAPPAV